MVTNQEMDDQNYSLAVNHHQKINNSLSFGGGIKLRSARPSLGCMYYSPLLESTSPPNHTSFILDEFGVRYAGLRREDRNRRALATELAASYNSFGRTVKLTGTKLLFLSRRSPGFVSSSAYYSISSKSGIRSKVGIGISGEEPIPQPPSIISRS